MISKYISRFRLGFVVVAIVCSFSTMGSDSISRVKKEKSLASNTTNPFFDPNIIVIHATLDSFARSDGPDQTISDGIITISNSCGYDSALLRVAEVLLGSYSADDIVVYQRLGEWCEGMWQSAVKEYFLFLRWNGLVWEVDKVLSSPLVGVNRAGLWLVEPVLLERLHAIHGPEAHKISVSEELRVALTIQRMEQVGLEFSPGASPIESAKAAEKSCSAESCWLGAPMRFSRGVSLASMREFLRKGKGDH